MGVRRQIVCFFLFFLLFLGKMYVLVTLPLEKSLRTPMTNINCYFYSKNSDQMNLQRYDVMIHQHHGFPETKRMFLPPPGYFLPPPGKKSADQHILFLLFLCLDKIICQTETVDLSSLKLLIFVTSIFQFFQ